MRTPPATDDTGSSAEALPLPSIRGSLLSRRHRLEHWQAHSPEADRLLAEVDAALARLDRGELGICTACQGSIEADRVAVDPLVSVCLDCLDPHERRLLEYDLELAAEVQASLARPAGGVVPSGWDLAGVRRQRGPVGGDWCDLLPYRDGMLAVIGDVSGKGVSGALLAAQIQTLFRAEADHDRDLLEMVARVNRLFCYASPDRAFATLVAAHLEPSGRARIVVAGHPSPLVRTGRTVHALTAGGPPIGILCAAGYVPVELQLEPGDALLVVTDGISEAAGPDGRELGLAPLSGLLAAGLDATADDLAQQSLELAARHRAGHPPSDDSTVLIALRCRVQ